MSDLKSWKKSRPGKERRVKCHGVTMQWLNTMLNGGFVCGGTYFITGGQNAGKSTLCKQIADSLSAGGNTVYYRDEEQSMKESIAVNRRLELKNDFFLETRDSLLPVELEDMGLTELMNFVLTSEKDADMDVMEKVIKLAKDMRNNDLKDGKFIWIVDSLQALVKGRGNALDVAERFRRLAIALDAVCIIVGQVTKGDKFAGFNALAHEVTCHMHIKVVENLGTQNQWRFLRLEKHRAGPTDWAVTNLAGAGHVFMEKEYVQKNINIEDWM